MGGYSSNTNEVIRAVLNPLFFYEKILYAPKAPTVTKTPRQKDKMQITFFPLDVF